MNIMSHTMIMMMIKIILLHERLEYMVLLNTCYNFAVYNTTIHLSHPPTIGHRVQVGVDEASFN